MLPEAAMPVMADPETGTAIIRTPEMAPGNGNGNEPNTGKGGQNNGGAGGNAGGGGAGDGGGSSHGGGSGN